MIRVSVISQHGPHRWLDKAIMFVRSAPSAVEPVCHKEG